MNNHPVGHIVLRRLMAMATYKGRQNMRITLLAYPLVPDFITDLIASRAGRVINLPMDLPQAWAIIENLHLDVILFPDWQPFPDQQSIVFHNQRMAPVQVCFFVRGSSCGGSQIDYYLMPSEFESAYLKEVPAVEINSRVNSSVIDDLGRRSTHVARPHWLERYSEQVVLVDWPVVTPDAVLEIFENVVKEISINNYKDKDAYTKFSANEIDNDSQSLNDIMSLTFSPLENEGNIFFDGQPVAVLPCFPEYLHPLMDEPLMKIIQSHPTLHLIVVIPEAFFLHVQDSRQKMSWARRLIRRLWKRGGILFNRIRLLPTPLSDKRLLQLFRQADVIIDTFPFGGPLSIHALGLSVGTPIITFANGIVLPTPTQDLVDLREFIDSLSERRKLEHHPLLRMIGRADIPWKPTTSVLAEFYMRYKFDGNLVAHNVSDFVRLVLKLVDNRELAYSLRVNILEAIDGKYQIPVESGTSRKVSSRNSVIKCESCIEDIRRFIVSVSMDWAVRRTKTLIEHERMKQKQELLERERREAANSNNKFNPPSSSAGGSVGSKAGRSKVQGSTRTRRRRTSPSPAVNLEETVGVHSKSEIDVQDDDEDDQDL